MKTTIPTWHKILGNDVLIDTVIKVGDKIKFCDNMRYEMHALEVTEIINGQIQAKDFDTNFIYPQWCMLDLEVSEN